MKSTNNRVADENCLWQRVQERWCWTADNWKAHLEKSVLVKVGPAAGWQVNIKFGCRHVFWFGCANKPELTCPQTCHQFWQRCSGIINGRCNINAWLSRPVKLLKNCLIAGEVISSSYHIISDVCPCKSKYIQLSPSLPSSLAPIKSRMETFWYRLIQNVLKNGRWISAVVHPVCIWFIANKLGTTWTGKFMYGSADVNALSLSLSILMAIFQVNLG